MRASLVAHAIERTQEKVLRAAHHRRTAKAVEQRAATRTDSDHRSKGLHEPRAGHPRRCTHSDYPSMIRSLIIDDEEDAREALRLTVAQYCPEVDILAVCPSPEAGIEAIQTLQPELVFLDIQMPRLSGFELLQQLSPVNFEVIFATAHDHYAIKAIRFSALDYLLKPVDIDDLIHAVGKVQERLQQKGSTFQYQSVLNNVQYRTQKIERLAIPTLEGVTLFRTEDIIYCQADGNYTKLFLRDQSYQLVTRNLKDFESLLAESGFYRVHRASLINLSHVREYVKGEGGYVILTDNHHVDVSRRNKEEFLGQLNRL